MVGIRFDSSTISWFFQYLDPLALKQNLLTSVHYLHIQPPLFNLFLGIVMKLANNLQSLVFNIVFMICGLITALVLYKLQRIFKIPRFYAHILTGFFIISPPVILYENWLFYTYPVMTLLIVSAYFYYQYLVNGKTKHLFPAMIIWTSIVLIRTAFHPLWLVACILFTVIFRIRDVKRILICASLPALIILLLMFKNALLFNMFGLSSWFGMNLYKMTLSVPQSTIITQIETKGISTLAMILPFQGPEQYQHFANFDTCTGIDVLDRKYKSTSSPNYNHIAYLSISKQYYTMARKLILKYPQYYFISVGKATYRFFMPTSDLIIFPGQNRRNIQGWVDFYENYLLGNILAKIWQTHFINRFGQTRVIHLNFLYFYLAFIYIGMIWFMKKGIKKTDLDDNKKRFLYFLCFQVLYVTITCNIVEYSENMRFRFLILPYIYIGLAVLLKSIVGKLRISAIKT